MIFVSSRHCGVKDVCIDVGGVYRGFFQEVHFVQENHQRIHLQTRTAPCVPDVDVFTAGKPLLYGLAYKKPSLRVAENLRCVYGDVSYDLFEKVVIFFFIF